MQARAPGAQGEGILSEIGFYHLTRTGALAALPKLLGRTLDSGQRALVRCRDPAGVSEALWASSEPPWLPHGSDGDAHAALHPIWLSAVVAPAPNGARYLMLLDGASFDDALSPPGFDRIFDLFDGNNDAIVEAARRRWAAAKAAGHALSYHQQSERGWSRKA